MVNRSSPESTEPVENDKLLLSAGTFHYEPIFIGKGSLRRRPLSILTRGAASHPAVTGSPIPSLMHSPIRVAIGSWSANQKMITVANIAKVPGFECE